jgi:preprotein translocase subunit SecA
MQRKPDQVTPGSAGEHVHGPNCNHDPVVETYRREAPKLGRNDPCFCGSGKKFKKCHGTSV